MDEELLLEESIKDVSNEIIFVNEDFGKLYRKTQTYNEDITFINEDAAEFIRKLKSEEGKDIWIVGGAGFIDTLMKEDLIDEYTITTMPLVLESWIPLFKEGNPEIKLKLNEVKTVDGMIISEYSRR